MSLGRMPKYQSTQPGWRVLVIYEGRKSIVVVSAQQGQHVGEMKVAAAAAGLPAGVQTFAHPTPRRLFPGYSFIELEFRV